MLGFFSKLLGKVSGSSRGGPGVSDAVRMVEDTLEGLLERSGLELDFDVEQSEAGVSVNFTGPDSELLTSREGLVLDAFQIYLRRVFQNKQPDFNIEISCDCDGFLDKSAQDLKDLATKLRDIVLSKGQPAFVRALPPRERKVVHRFLAEDGRVRSQSIGDGFCKKIKITVNNGQKSTFRRNDQAERGAPESEA